MKKRTKIFYCHAAVLLVFMTAGCTGGNDDEPGHSSSPAGEAASTRLKQHQRQKKTNP